MKKLKIRSKELVKIEPSVIHLEQRIKDYVIYGRENIEQEALDQMEAAMRLPITVKGALMPDAHVGYGLPIGGGLATRNAVIPYAVGVDIAGRVKKTVIAPPPVAVGDR